MHWEESVTYKHGTYFDLLPSEGCVVDAAKATVFVSTNGEMSYSFDPKMPEEKTFQMPSEITDIEQAKAYVAALMVLGR